MTDERPNFLVFGVGHSGTSILTKMLFALGWSEGGPPGTADASFAEHVQIRQYNRYALDRGELPPEVESLLDGLETPWAVKDPRFVVTLPLWEARFNDRGELPTLLWVTRSLEDVRQSYVRRNEMIDGRPGSHGYTVEQLWNLAELNYSRWRGSKVTIGYEQLAEAVSLFSSSAEPTDASDHVRLQSTSPAGPAG